VSSRIKEALNAILERFESGDIPEAVAVSTFPMADIPSSRWSFLNRLIMYLAGTSDARGFRQWQKAKRHVKKGARAFYIIVPKTVKVRDENGDEQNVLSGFLAKPVFRYEDTDGEALKDTTPKLPDLPLIEKAKEWGISVKAIPGNYRYYGYFSKSKNEIALATKEETVFFHELAHAAHSKIKTKKERTRWAEEIVAELSAAALCRIVGKTSKNLGNSYQYIKIYAKQANLSPVKACLEVLQEVESTLRLILHSQKDIYELELQPRMEAPFYPLSP
jgi:antirestriction protein ArdC